MASEPRPALRFPLAGDAPVCPAGEHREPVARPDEEATPCVFCGRLMPTSFTEGGGAVDVAACWNDDNGTWWFERDGDPDGLDRFAGQAPARLVAAHETAVLQLEAATHALVAAMRLDPTEPRFAEPCHAWTGAQRKIPGRARVMLHRDGRRPVEVCGFDTPAEAQEWIDDQPESCRMLMLRDVVVFDRSNLAIETTEPAYPHSSCDRCGWGHYDHPGQGDSVRVLTDSTEASS